LRSKRRESTSGSIKSIFRGRTSHAKDIRGLAVSDLELSRVATPVAGSRASIAMVMDPIPPLAEPKLQPVPQTSMEQMSLRDMPISQPQEAHSFDASKTNRKKAGVWGRLSRWLTGTKTHLSGGTPH
jgi:hypothetical protein